MPHSVNEIAGILCPQLEADLAAMLARGKRLGVGARAEITESISATASVKDRSTARELGVSTSSRPPGAGLISPLVTQRSDSATCPSSPANAGPAVTRATRIGVTPRMHNMMPQISGSHPNLAMI
jgi:hypothetical protein